MLADKAGASSPPSSPPLSPRTMATLPKLKWRRVADQLRPKLPKLAAFLDEAETDVLAYMTLPGRAPDQATLDQPDRAPQWRDQAAHRASWAVQRARYMTLETIALLSDDPVVNLPALAG